jgi:hypothetical protein
VTAPDVPFFVVSRDRLTPLIGLVQWLEQAGHEEIVIVDNASTYPPLLEYLDTSPHTVVRLADNLGHLSPWTSGTINRLARGRWYAVSDPDVHPVPECPADAVEHLRQLLRHYPQYIKAGLGLKIDDLPDHYAHKQQVQTWESQYWLRRMQRGVWQARVDTTFAVYRPYEPSFEYAVLLAMRTDAPYLARHLPWYSNLDEPTEEDAYYRAHARADITTWETERAGGGTRSQADDVETRLTPYRWATWQAHRLLRIQRARVDD